MSEVQFTAAGSDYLDTAFVTKRVSIYRSLTCATAAPRAAPRCGISRTVLLARRADIRQHERSEHV